MFISPLAQKPRSAAAPCSELTLERLELERLLDVEISEPQALDGETRNQILRSLIYRLQRLGYVRRLKKRLSAGPHRTLSLPGGSLKSLRNCY